MLHVGIDILNKDNIPSIFSN